jgi:2,4-dienoyl-CoA reductase-like NADH-dependent reductase (Old Yellow Enzyme family)
MYVGLAKNGVSLIIVEGIGVDIRHAREEPRLLLDDPKFEAGLHRLVEAVHLCGVPIVMQLQHPGMIGKDPISPSGVACYGFGRKHYIQPRVMSLAEIEEAKDLFIEAAVRGMNVEADGVVLHGATSYLLEQFVSPHTNKRTDRYGGSLENCITLPLEIVRGIRQRYGASFALGLLPSG